MLTPEETELITGMLRDALAQAPLPRTHVLSPFGGAEFGNKLRIDLVTPQELAAEAVRICIADGYGHQPPWLTLLLSVVPLQDPIPLVLKRLSSTPPAAPDPLDETLLATDMPFVNRSDLRDRLRVLRHPQSLKPILVVTGPRKSGKSYSALLIDHYCGRTQNILHCQVPLREGQEELTGAQEVASDMVAAIGGRLDDLPAPNTNEDRWTLELAIWVLRKAAATTQDWWFVLDGFNGPQARPDARKLIVHLADRVTTGISARRFRVILLDFDRTTLTVPPGKVLLEQISPVQPQEIATCVQEILRRTGKQADVSSVVQSIVNNLPTDENRLFVLNRLLLDLLEESAHA